VDQNEKLKLLIKCIVSFSIISLFLVYLTSSLAKEDISTSWILYGIYACVFVGGVVRAFISPTIFSLLSLIVPKNLYANAATWSSSVWQMGSVLGPAIAGFVIHWFGVTTSLSFVL